MSNSVFAEHRRNIYRNSYRATLLVEDLRGGTPMDPKIVETWLTQKLAGDEAYLVKVLNEIQDEIGLDKDLTDEEIIAEAARRDGLSGFKRLPSGELYIEERQIKAMLKEAANIAVGAGHLKGRGWGVTNKGVKNFIAEHVFIEPLKVGLGVVEPTGVAERVGVFSGPRGPRTGFVREEYIADAKVSFQVMTDFEWGADFWPTIWVMAEKNGLGASRSQGFGTFEVVEWEEL